MGLTYKNCKIKSLQDSFNIKQKENSYIVALAGNPNTGKSTVFNYLTGLKQHTGNWPGKTIATARGEFTYNNIEVYLSLVRRKLRAIGSQAAIHAERGVGYYLEV